MGSKIHKTLYLELIDNDIKWLKENTKGCLERSHILSIIQESTDHYYPPINKDQQITNYKTLIRNALAIKDLWLPQSDIKEEHQGEASALSIMHQSFEEILKND